MHVSSSEKIRLLRHAYLEHVEDKPLSILEIGSAVIPPQPQANRIALANPRWSYAGLDIAPGNNVDIVVTRPYDWQEIGDGTFDVAVCVSVFEHTEFFWITINEVARVLKPLGLLFLIAPSAGPLHRYPQDCWRFYEDGFPALTKWSGLSAIESGVQRRPLYPRGNQWRDATLVAQRPIRTETEDRMIAMRAAYGRSALSGEAPQEPSHLALESSIIGPATNWNALSTHEDKLLAGKNRLAYKLRLMNRHRRRLFQIVKTPVDKILDQ